MSYWAFFLIGLLLILAALRRSRRAVKLYFRAQLVATLALFVGVKVLGDHADLYTWLYIGVTLPILETCCLMIWEAGLDARLLLASIDFGLLMGVIAAFDLRRNLAGDYVTFGEGVLLSSVGMAMLLAAPTSDDKLAVKTIGALSLGLSCFDFIYLLNLGWESLNGWLPSAMGIVAFGWIAISRGQSLPVRRLG